MLVALGLMAAVIGMMLAFPDTGTARMLSHWLIAAPAAALNRVARGKMVFYGLMAGLGLVLILLFEAEGMRLFGFLLPDTLVWFAMFDVGVFVDALLITGAVLATNGMRAIRAEAIALPRQVATVTRRWRTSARRGATLPARPKRTDDDDDRPARPRQPAYLAFSIA